MKKIITILFLIAVLCFCFISCGDNNLGNTLGNSDITFSVENGEAVVTSVPNKSTVTEIVIPDEYESVPVTEISKFAAVNLEYVTKITIGKNVKEISDWAFGNSKKIAEFVVDDENAYICDVDGVIYTKDMKTLLFYPPAGNHKYQIPEGVETIRTKAFYKCQEFTDVTFPSTLKNIEEKAFFRCDLKSIDLPDGLFFIGKDAFSFCASVESVTIPASVKQIDEYAFFGCTSMHEVNMEGTEAGMTLGKKWYPTNNGVDLDPPVVINWNDK